MELRQLETFTLISDTRSFTKAADMLSITQPAASRQIAALEAELRTRLFDRIGRTVALTPAGTALYAYSSRIVRLATEAQSAVAEVTGGASGKLSVGASSTAAAYVLPPILRRYRDDHPGIELSIHTGPSRRIGEMVAANEVDIGVVMDVASQPGLTQTALANYSDVLVVYPDHELAATNSANGATVPITALRHSSLVTMQAGTSLRDAVERLLGDEEIAISMELDNVEAIKKMVEAKFGVSILPLLAVRDEVVTGKLVALPLAGGIRTRQTINAIHRTDKYLTAAIRAFIALLEAEFSRLEGLVME